MGEEEVSELRMSEWGQMDQADSEQMDVAMKTPGGWIGIRDWSTNMMFQGYLRSRAESLGSG